MYLKKLLLVSELVGGLVRKLLKFFWDRGLTLGVRVLVVLALGVCLTPAPTLAASDAPAAYTFAFRDADIAQVAEEILGNNLGITYTIDPAVSGKMSFRIDRKLTRAQLLEAFEAALSANDVVMIRRGDALELLPRTKARGAAGLTTASARGGRAGYEIVAVPLSYASPSEVAKALESIGSPGIVVYQNDKQGLLMLGGDGREIDAAMQMIKVFDRSGLEGSHIRWFELQKAPALTVAGDLEKVMQTAAISGVSIIPLKRLNGIFVVARTPEAMEAVGTWIQRLDEPSKDQGATLWVYHPRNVSAESISQTLNSVMSGRSVTSTTSATAGPAGAGGQGGPAAAAAPPPATMEATGQSASFFTSDDDPVRIGLDKDSNTLLISASPAKWTQIQRILQEIDIRPDQVLIEASILEVTLTDNLKFGVDWSVIGANGKLKFSSAGDSGGASTTPSTPGLGITFMDNHITAAVNALKAVTTVEVVSAPKIVTLDNHAAKLQVGDQVPVITGSSQTTTAPGAPIVTQTDYRSTGVILNVTPRITGDDNVTLDITQEVSAADSTTSSGIDSPTIQQRHLESSLILHDGGTVALGGLISSNKTVTSTGVPWVKDIPYVGKLFKTDTKNLTRTELIILISAKILKDQVSTDRVMGDLLSDMRDIEDHGLVKTYVRK